MQIEVKNFNNNLKLYFDSFPIMVSVPFIHKELYFDLFPFFFRFPLNGMSFLFFLLCLQKGLSRARVIDTAL